MKFPVLIEGWGLSKGERVQLIETPDDFPLNRQFRIFKEEATLDHLEGAKAALTNTDEDDIPF